MRTRAISGLAAAGVIALALSGCVPNTGIGSAALTVDITDDTCVVSEATAATGAITFALTNSGTDVNEFEILAEDKLRIVGEKENVTPGQTVSYVAQLAPGTYFTACKFQLIGAPIGLAEFTVTGEASATSDPGRRPCSTSASTSAVVPNRRTLAVSEHSVSEHATCSRCDPVRLCASSLV